MSLSLFLQIRAPGGRGLSPSATPAIPALRECRGNGGAREGPCLQSTPSWLLYCSALHSAAPHPHPRDSQVGRTEGGSCFVSGQRHRPAASSRGHAHQHAGPTLVLLTNQGSLCSPPPPPRDSGRERNPLTQHQAASGPDRAPGCSPQHVLQRESIPWGLLCAWQP